MTKRKRTWKQTLEELRLAPIKRRIKAAFAKKKKPARVIPPISDDED